MFNEKRRRCTSGNEKFLSKLFKKLKKLTYFIIKSALKENTLLAQFTRKYTRDSSGVFSI